MIVTTRHIPDSVEHIEKENLAAHVEICYERFKALEHRVGAVEHEIDHFVIDNDSTRQAVIQAIVAMGTLLAVIVPITIFLVERFKV
jgi:hypothetical protein